MSDKLDPELRQLVDAVTLSAMAGSVSKLRILVALSRPAEATDRVRLKEAGLEMGSEAGEILTGTIATSRLEALAADPLVVKIEGSRPLEPERP